MTNQKSSVLFLSISSRNKRKGGSEEYSTEKSVVNYLSPKFATYLIALRKNLLSQLPKINWHHVPIDELKLNKDLVKGPDFGGEFQGKYLPSIMRYSGRYYSALSEKVSLPDDVLLSPHHFLILSGLYGMVSSSDSIQLYTCPVEIESKNVQEHWRENNRLTLILQNYLVENKIKRIFDLTSRSIYRDLINWNYIKKNTDVETLHCFIDQAAGDPALSEFGSITGELLKMSEMDLLNIKPGSVIPFDEATMICHHLTIQPKGYPAEPIIGLPQGYETEEEINTTHETLNFEVKSFELKMKGILEGKSHKFPQLWNNFPNKKKNNAIKQMERHISDYPSLEDSDLSPIQFLLLDDIRHIITENWSLFEKEFGNLDNFINHFETIREVRNKLDHPYKVRIPIPLIKRGEGSIIWFKEIFERIEKKNIY